MEETLKKKLNNVLDNLNEVIKLLQKNNLQNEQFALDFMDEVNKLSVIF